MVYQNKGEMTIGSMLFYGMSFLILVSIPITIVLLKTEKDSITRASSSPVNFSSPPTTDVQIEPTDAKAGERITLQVISTNSNWTALYFSPSFPVRDTPVDDKNLTIVAQGPQIDSANYSSNTSGYFMIVAFQLQGSYGEFKSGDVMCSWNGGLYIYKKKSSNPLNELINSNSRYEGSWERLTTCQNIGPKQLHVSQ